MSCKHDGCARSDVGVEHADDGEGGRYRLLLLLLLMVGVVNMLELMMGVSSGSSKKLESNVPGRGEGGDDRRDKLDSFRVRDANGLCELDVNEGDGEGSVS